MLGDKEMKRDKESLIITIYLIVEALCKNLLEVPPQKQKLTDAEVITIAICSALFFNSNHDKALSWLHAAGYFPEILSLSRFNRRIHRLKSFISLCFESIREIFLTGELYIQDSMPIPVCKYARSRRNKKARGREHRGYCAAKKEYFFGFRLHLITNAGGLPVSLEILPASYHDLTPIYELTAPLKNNSIVIGDKAFNSKEDEKSLLNLGTFLMPKRKKNMKNQWTLFEERFILNEHRHQIETTFSILHDVMSLGQIKSTTLAGFFLKIEVAVLALLFYLSF